VEGMREIGNLTNQERSILHNLLNKAYQNCWICGKEPDDKHHFPPKAINPKMFIKIPICKSCHCKLNTGNDYTAQEKRSLRANIKRIEKSCKNIRGKLLDKKAS
jgi:hypothetical protein